MQEESAGKLYHTIGEVSEMLNLTASQLRFWEQEFDVLKPKKNKKGNRIYVREDIETIKLIHYLTKEKGHTLQGAKDQLNSQRKTVEKNLQIMESLKKLKLFLIELKEGL